jgi:hypothetical protein
LGLGAVEIKLKEDLPNLWYVGLFNVQNWENGGFTPGEEWSWFETLSEDLKDPSIPCEEKRKALLLLWNNVRKLLKEGYEPITYNEDYPTSHWWWHPELWDKGLDPLEVLNDICSQD